MKGGTREVVFFGSVTSSVINVNVKNEYGLSQLKQRKGKFRFSTSLKALHPQVEETLGMNPSSESFEISALNFIPEKSGEKQVNLPLVLEMAGDIAASMPTADIDPTYVEGVEELELDSADPLAKKSVCASAALEISVELGWGEETPVKVASKRFSFRSLNHEAVNEPCALVQIDISNTFFQKGSTSADVRIPETLSEREIGASVFFLVRVIDMSQKPAVIFEADRVLGKILNKPDPVSNFSMQFTKKKPVPYGCMSLEDLYEHYRLFFSRCFATVLGHQKSICSLIASLCETKRGGSCLEIDDSKSLPYRWCMVKKVNLQTVVLGEAAFTPLLATLSHCSSVSHLLLNRNELGDLTCARLCALFSRHRYLSHISLEGNRIHEGGADQLLRLLRRNTRIVNVNIKRCYCSEAIADRIASLASTNSTNIDEDPLNLFSSKFDYLSSPEALQPTVRKLAMGVWAMLSASAVGDIDVWVRNLTTKGLVDNYIDDSEAPRIEAASTAGAAGSSFIPAVAKAPLLNEVVRTVSIGIARVVPDPLIRALFTDAQEAADYRRQQAQLNSAVTADQESPEVRNVLKKIFRTDTIAVADEESIYASSFLRVVVITARSLCLRLDWNETVKELKEIGKTQRMLGVSWEDYWLAMHIVAKALYICFGSEELSTERVSAFISMIALGIRACVDAF